tara:strand:- start:2911 stop:3162 length:252 start_codon:yes stop_codon:yes gene_type:complete
MEFEIKSGVPIPKNRGKPRKYDLPLDDLDIGQMVLVPMATDKIQTEIKTIRNFVLRYKKKFENENKNFTVAQRPNGVGIWRTQ